MEKNNVDFLVQKAYEIGQNGIYDNNMRLYNRSNEELSEIFKHYNVKDKDVLTVLASSDQLFSCYSKGAANVDTFDKVYPSLYYYYLRRWLILYNKKFYPSMNFFDNGDKSIYNLVCSVVPREPKEAEAREFWMKYLKLNNYKTDQYLFDVADINRKAPFHHEINKIQRKLLTNKLNFKCINLQNDIPYEKKYDVLILSNMLEYVHDVARLVKLRDNIEVLLKKDGIAICSNKMYPINSETHRLEEAVLTSNKLVSDTQYDYYEALFANKKDLAYSYRLK